MASLNSLASDIAVGIGRLTGSAIIVVFGAYMMNTSSSDATSNAITELQDQTKPREEDATSVPPEIVQSLQEGWNCAYLDAKGWPSDYWGLPVATSEFDAAHRHLDGLDGPFKHISPDGQFAEIDDQLRSDVQLGSWLCTRKEQ